MKLLFAAAEAFPFAKSGGLADVAHALPKALGAFADVTVVMPLYRFIDKKAFGISDQGKRKELFVGGVCHIVSYHFHLFEGVRHCFVYNETLCEKEHLYGDDLGDYADNDLRFSIFSHAIVDLSRALRVDLLHLNDWHTALAAVLMKDRGERAKVVYTIHNLAYQGIFPASSLRRIGLARKHYQMDDMEFYGKINWMKGGIAHGDAVTTVSPTYAREIQTPRFGCGLDGFLRRHREKIVGILNGIDTTLYDPAHDLWLECRYRNLEKKRECKRKFLDEIDIKKYDWPLFIFIGRFVAQKGVDLIIDTLEEISQKPMILAILGEGEKRYHKQLEKVAQKSENIYLRFGYDEALSHRMYAAADFLLMPSRFEPCGLNQMISMRYGALPIVHRVGGLADTVHGLQERVCGLGLSVEPLSVEALLGAIEQALLLFEQKESYEESVRFNLSCDFSIQRCAKNYFLLYKALV